MPILRIALQLVLLWACCISPVFSQTEVSVLQKSIRMPITNNDIEAAQTLAFEKLYQQILQSAVLDLIQISAFNLYRPILEQEIFNQPEIWFRSVKVVEESNDQIDFSLTLTAQIHSEELAQKLETLWIPLKNADKIPIAVIFEKNPYLVFDSLKSHLQILNLNPKAVEQTTASAKKLGPTQIKNWFQNNPDHNILHYYSYANQNGSELLAVHAYKKNVRRPLAQINWSFKQDTPTTPAQLFLQKLNLQSLKVQSYKNSIQRSFVLVLNNSNSLRATRLFEAEHLSRFSNIESYWLSEKTTHQAIYQLKTGDTLANLATKLTRNGLQTRIQTKVADNQLITDLEFTRKVVNNPLTAWSYNARLANRLRALFPKQPTQWKPDLVENEPNNHAQQYNALPMGKKVLGHLNSRLEEDLFQVNLSKATQQIEINLLHPSKTTFSPRLKLYDQNHDLLATFPNIYGLDHQKISYRFRGAVPSNVLIRIDDQVGFIPNEPGQVKPYVYILSVSFKTLR